MQGIRLPDGFAALDAEFASGERVPAQARDAATVVLMREGSPVEGPEVYLMVRRSTMDFAPGMAVFPGGGVDPHDFDEALVDAGLWVGPSPQEWADRLGCEVDRARALVCAAVRETFEECGVLLAGPDADSAVTDLTSDDWESDRADLEAHRVSLTELLTRRSLVLRTDLLGVWAGWLTPRTQPKRYRTWFFVARLPEGQRARDVSTESSTVGWWPVSRALASVDAGELSMLPPTYLSCVDLLASGSADQALADAHGRKVEMFMPQLITGRDGRPTFDVPARLEALARALEDAR